jgi:3-hydroxymyristoyl/3-hydroxydecanoyl-(acyl carrier protein) dehydratase
MLRYPVIKSVQQTGNQVILNLFLPYNILYFNGHFPDYPMLPGVIQINWAIEFSQKYLQILPQFKRLEVVKFHKLILPDMLIKLKLEHNTLKHKTTFSYSNDKTIYSSGRIVWG